MIRNKKTRKHRPILRGRLFPIKANTAKGWCGIAVICPNCDREHFHGWKIGDKKPAHRLAHCTDEQLKPSIFHETGYWIAPFRAKDLKLMTGA